MERAPTLVDVLAARNRIRHTRNLAESAGAAYLSGALRRRERLAGKRVALVCSGGSMTAAQLLDVLASRVPPTV